MFDSAINGFPNRNQAIGVRIREESTSQLVKMWQIVVVFAGLLSSSMLCSNYASASAIRDVTTSEDNSTTPGSPHLRPIVVTGKDGENYSEEINNTVEYIFLFTFKEFRKEGELKVQIQCQI